MLRRGVATFDQLKRLEVGGVDVFIRSLRTSARKESLVIREKLLIYLRFHELPHGQGD